MRINEALDYLTERAKSAKTREVQITLNEIYGVIVRADTRDGVRWSVKIEQVAAYVEAKNIRVGCRADAVKLLNKRKYE
jgi:proline racemase